MHNFKVPLCAETLNTSHIRINGVFITINHEVPEVCVLALFASANSLGGNLSSRISFLDELYPATHTSANLNKRSVCRHSTLGLHEYTEVR